MRFLIFGMGAIGTYIGGSLTLGGESVIYLERSEVAGRFNLQPLILEIEGKEKTFVPEGVSDSLEKVFGHSPIDVALVAVKSFDTLEVARRLQPYRDQISAVVSLQNGVENEEVLAGYVEKDRVIAGTLTSAVGKKETGKVILEKKRGIGIARGHPLSESIVESFNRANLNARLYPHAGEMKWSKLLTNLLANATSAILDLTPAEIFSDPRLFRIETAQVREAVRVMKRLGYRVVDLPGTPVRLLSVLFHNIPEGIARLLAGKTLAAGRGGKMPSFHVDLYRGYRPLEVDYLNGAVVRFGERLGVATPVNSFLNETLLSIAERPIEENVYRKNPERLIAELSKRVRLFS
ncbi:MAG: ketopantoate reductase family protein [Chloroflexota bacterium]